EQNLLEPHGVRGERAQVFVRLDDEAFVVLLGKLFRGADDSSISRAKSTRSGLSSSLPASIFERSSISLMRLRRWVPAAFTRLASRGGWRHALQLAPSTAPSAFAEFSRRHKDKPATGHKPDTDSVSSP